MFDFSSVEKKFELTDVYNPMAAEDIVNPGKYAPNGNKNVILRKIKNTINRIKFIIKHKNQEKQI